MNRLQFRRPLSALTLALACAAPLAFPQHSQAQGRSQATQQRATITDFQMQPAQRLRPGEVLSFQVHGTPGAVATVRITGAAAPLALSETRPGVYTGEYTIRRQDRLSADGRATARVAKNGSWAEQPLSQPLLANADGSLLAQNDRDGRDGQRRDDRNQPSNTDDDGRRDRRGTPVSCAQCGRVVSVTQVDVDGNSKNIIGSVAGGVLGGVLGHQVGGGSGKDLATVIGAVGGAYAGNRIQNNSDKRRVHRVDVRMDNGGTQSFDYADDPQMRNGSLVRVENGVLVKR